jgi:hypothetical protein
MVPTGTKRGMRAQTDWFGLGSSSLFVFIGALLLGRAMWHMLMHNDLMLRTLMGGALFIGLGVLFAREALRSSSSRKRSFRK